MFLTDAGLHGCNWPSRRSVHFNPTGEEHGDSRSCWRHVGDLDPVAAATHGQANFTSMDRKVQIVGPTSVLGRAIVILTRQKDSQNELGERLCCGTIGRRLNSNFSLQVQRAPCRYTRAPTVEYL